MNTQEATEPPTTYHLRDSSFVAEILVDHGGRVVSLRRPRGGREWLADSGRRIDTGGLPRWQDGDTRGWDECFPNISAGPHPDLGTHLTDHGSLWNARPITETTSRGAVSRWNLPALDGAFTRELRAHRGGLLASYSAVSHRRTPVRVAWAMHLLLDAPVSSIGLSPNAAVRVDSAFGVTVPDHWSTGWTTWRAVREHLPLSESGWACKVFTRPGGVRSITVRVAGEMLVVTLLDHRRTMNFGLWLNAAGWPEENPLTHVGVEAGFGDRDDLISVVESGTALELRRGVATSWNVHVKMKRR